ncbi:hypothetical protein ACH5RR_029411 [Cinchona calisaya]|uniref:Uncharacterized protein n=1 Tax=Cinchona calisaya TaxID=153742 RepID=A0ABD2YVF3_9GENT
MEETRSSIQNLEVQLEHILQQLARRSQHDIFIDHIPTRYTQVEYFTFRIGMEDQASEGMEGNKVIKDNYMPIEVVYNRPAIRSIATIVSSSDDSIPLIKPSTYKREPTVFLLLEVIQKLALLFLFSLEPTVGKFSKGRSSMEALCKEFQKIGFVGSYTLGLPDYRHISFDQLPPHLFHKAILFSIGHLVGEPLEIDISTANGTRPSKARLWKNPDAAMTNTDLQPNDSIRHKISQLETTFLASGNPSLQVPKLSSGTNEVCSKNPSSIPSQKAFATVNSSKPASSKQ